METQPGTPEHTAAMRERLRVWAQRQTELADRHGSLAECIKWVARNCLRDTDAIDWDSCPDAAAVFLMREARRPKSGPAALMTFMAKLIQSEEIPVEESRIVAHNRAIGEMLTEFKDAIRKGLITDEHPESVDEEPADTTGT